MIIPVNTGHMRTLAAQTPEQVEKEYLRGAAEVYQEYLRLAAAEINRLRANTTQARAICRAALEDPQHAAETALAERVVNVLNLSREQA